MAALALCCPVGLGVSLVCIRSKAYIRQPPQRTHLKSRFTRCWCLGSGGSIWQSGPHPPSRLVFASLAPLLSSLPPRGRHIYRSNLHNEQHNCTVLPPIPAPSSPLLLGGRLEEVCPHDLLGLCTGDDRQRPDPVVGRLVSHSHHLHVLEACQMCASQTVFKRVTGHD